MKKIFYMLALLLIPINVYASDAINITNEASFTVDNKSISKLTDNNIKTYYKLEKDNNLLIHSDNGNIKQLYIVYEFNSQHGKLSTNTGEEKEIGTEGFLHEYVNIDKSCETITLTYDNEVSINEIYAYTDGDTPTEVQKWKKEETADLMIFSTHADDEQLFFAGVMPTYINQGKKVHVVYFARHDVGAYYAPNRLHEQLNGLWALGVTDYPTFGIIPDAYSESIDVARKQMNSAGFSDDDVINFYVTQLRKYKPKVILGHDENGEYGHGQHRLNIDILKKSYDEAANAEYKNVLEEAYKVPKFYIHLYDLDNKTELNYDIPLEKYNGKTAYQVSKEGYAKHLSQQYTWFTAWLNGNNNQYTSYKQIAKYNPAYWGLYKTEVGPDVKKDDLFENIPEEKENKPSSEDISRSNYYKESTYISELYNLYDKDKEVIIIISGVIVIISMFLIVQLKKNQK